MTHLTITQQLQDVPSILKKLSIVFSLLIALLPPLGYLSITYYHQSIQLKQSAHQAADSVSKLAFINPDAWDLQYYRLEHIVNGFHPTEYEVDIFVQDAAGQDLLPDSGHHFSLPIMATSDIKNNTEFVGKVIFEKNFIPTIITSFFLALTSLVIALIFLFLIHRFSIRGIEKASMEIKSVHDELAKKSLYLDSLLNSTRNLAIVSTDKKWNILYYNKSAEQLFGKTYQKVIHLPFKELHPDLWDRICELLQSATETHSVYSFVYQQGTVDKKQYIEVQVNEISDRQEAVSGYTVLCADITSEHEAAEMIEYHATYDDLTRLPNRRLFEEKLKNALSRSRRHNTLGAVLFMDLDNFKNINDSLGHAVGDFLLKEVANRLKNCLRKEDDVSRLGGDEFVVLLTDFVNEPDEVINSIQTLAEKIRQRISLPYVIDKHTLHISSSIGISVFPGDKNNTSGDIMRQADTAMYRAKESGRNAFRFFLPSMQCAVENRQKLLTDLRHALKNNEFLIHYQPQFNQKRTIIGVEALVRWQHPEKGLIYPNKFIPVAEESGLIIELGNYVLNNSLEDLDNWLSDGIIASTFQMSVNISAQQFMQNDFIQNIQKILKKTAAKPHNLTLELTESILLTNVENAIKTILSLRKIGARFSIDDFGTGYSSLAYLKRLPVDEVKIDRTFVRDVLKDDSDAALIEVVVYLSSRLKLQSVAEGVETEEQFQYLKKLGCDKFQGYFFSRPVSEKNLVALLSSHHLVQS